VAAVGEGEAAVQATLEHRPDVVLLDYRLPGMDGVQTTRAIRAAAPDVAVVCLTGAADVQETQALYEAGAVACVTKDEEVDTIVGTVVRAAA
jgi:DNA-binding NarL/FixJ family response regulator